MLRQFIVASAVLGLLGACPAQAAINASVIVDTHAPGVRIAPEIYGQFAEELGQGIEPRYLGRRELAYPEHPRLSARRRRGAAAAACARRALAGRLLRRHLSLAQRHRSARQASGHDQLQLGRSRAANQFGTHEYFDFAELIGAKTYLSVNIGSGTPAEARDWVEYVSSDKHSAVADERRANGRDKPWTIDYVGLGNEMWGCGGNSDRGRGFSALAAIRHLSADRPRS